MVTKDHVFGSALDKLWMGLAWVLLSDEQLLLPLIARTAKPSNMTLVKRLSIIAPEISAISLQSLVQCKTLKYGTNALRRACFLWLRHKALWERIPV